MLINHTLVLLPQLKAIAADLDIAIAEDDTKAAIRTLVGYLHSANQVASLLEQEEGLQDLVVSLRASAQSASQVKGSLVIGGSSRTLAQVTKKVAKEISDVAAQCSGVAARYQMKVA